MSVRIISGRHRHPVPAGSEKLILEELDRANLDTSLNWIIVMGPAITGTPHMKRFRLISLDESYQRIEVGIKPGNNNSSRICYIRPPKGGSLSLVKVHNLLAKVNGKELIVSKSTADAMEKLVSGGSNGHSVPKPVDFKKGISVSDILKDSDTIQLFLLDIWPEPTSLAQVSPEVIKGGLRSLVGREPTAIESKRLLVQLHHMGYLIYRRKAKSPTVELATKGFELLGRLMPLVLAVDPVVEVPTAPVAQVAEEESVDTPPTEEMKASSTEDMLLQTIAQLEARVLQLQHEIGRNQAALNAFREFAAS